MLPLVSISAGGLGSGWARRIISRVARSRSALPERPTSSYESTLPSASTTKRRRFIPSLPRACAAGGYFLYLLRWASKVPSQLAFAATCWGEGPGAGAADFSGGVLVGGVSEGFSCVGFSFTGSGFTWGLGGCGLGLGLTGLGTEIVGFGASASLGNGNSSTGAGGCGGVMTLGGAGGGGAGGSGASSTIIACGGSSMGLDTDQFSMAMIATA